MNAVFMFSMMITLAVAAAFPSAETVAVNWNVTAAGSKNNKVIIQNVFGAAGKGKLHAIIGPSGSGKTTLLNVLADTVPRGSMRLTGTRTLVNEPAGQEHNAPKKTAFVQQEDLLFAQLTTLETLKTSADLRGSSDKARVGNMILDLGLKKVTNTRVGDAKTRGVSGGEKRRLSIGNELIGLGHQVSSLPPGDRDGVDTAVIFADEPTSGLDSYQAQKVMELLRDLSSKSGHTVIASIHQPRVSIFKLFDEISLLSEGRVIYTGPAQDMVSYFASIGFPCPQNYNPCEYYIDLVSIDYSSPEEESKCRQRINKLADLLEINQRDKYSSLTRQLASLQAAQSAQSQSRALSAAPARNREKGMGGFLRGIGNSIIHTFNQFGILFQRAFRQVTRDKPLNIARLMSSLFSSLLFGAIYFRLSDSAATVPDRLGLLQVAAVNTAMTSLIKATTSFVTEKLIIQRERKSDVYPVGTYFLSKLAAEVPISALFPCFAGQSQHIVCVYYLDLINCDGRRRKLTVAIVVSKVYLPTQLPFPRIHHVQAMWSEPSPWPSTHLLGYFDGRGAGVHCSGDGCRLASQLG